MARPKKPETPSERRVVRRAPEDRKKLDPRFEPLVRGERMARRNPAPALQDPRVGALVPGVANRDARGVAEARLGRMRAARTADGALAPLLFEAVQLGLWRGLALTGFDAMVEQLLDLPAAEARGMVAAEAHRLGVTAGPAREHAVATWLRAEASLLGLGVDARVRLAGDSFVVEVPTRDAPAALVAIGARLRQLCE